MPKRKLHRRRSANTPTANWLISQFEQIPIEQNNLLHAKKKKKNMGCTHSSNANANQVTSITVSSPSAKKRVVVIGASGFVGGATLKSLVDRHSSNVEIYAGVRDPSKFQDMPGVTPIKADLNNKTELTTLLKDFDRAFIVTP